MAKFATAKVSVHNTNVSANSKSKSSVLENVKQTEHLMKNKTISESSFGSLQLEIIVEKADSLLWGHFLANHPHATIFNEIATQKKIPITGDHFAFRSFKNNNYGIDYFNNILKLFGYKQAGSLDFGYGKKAFHYKHQALDVAKIFVSEVDLNALPKSFSDIVESITEDGAKSFLSEECIESLKRLNSGKMIGHEKCDQIVKAFVNGFKRKWNPPAIDKIEDMQDCINFVEKRVKEGKSADKYNLQQLENMKYAYWTALNGWHINHHTFLIQGENHDLPNIMDVFEEMKAKGIGMNKSGIVGNPLLMQTSSMAILGNVEVRDERGIIRYYETPIDFVEFATRGKDKEGNLFEGFEVANANQIFPSTNVENAQMNKKEVHLSK